MDFFLSVNYHKSCAAKPIYAVLNICTTYLFANSSPHTDVHTLESEMKKKRGTQREKKKEHSHFLNDLIIALLQI